MPYSIHLNATLCYLLMLCAIPLRAQDRGIEIYRLTKGSEMEAVYNKILFHDIAPKELDDIRSHIAMQYAFENQLDKASMFVDSISSIPLRANRYFILARARFQLKEDQQAKYLADKAYAIALAHAYDKYPEFNSALQPATILSYTTTLLTEILVAKQSYEEAIDYIDRSFERIEKDSGVGLQLLKAPLLEKLNKRELALASYLYAFKRGRQSDEIKNKLRYLYQQSHPTDGLKFDAFLTDVVQTKRKQLIDSVKEHKNLEKAPNFKLKNIHGKTVSLKDLKGKVVILDFWATWCTPCKASFPALQKAVDKYADKPDIVFLFINTWEKNENAVREARKYMIDNQFTFNVLFDSHDDAHRYKVVEDYQIKGLPSKIFIDRNGLIRCRLTGFNGDQDETLSEISEIIKAIM